MDQKEYWRSIEVWHGQGCFDCQSEFRREILFAKMSFFMLKQTHEQDNVALSTKNQNNSRVLATNQTKSECIRWNGLCAIN